MIYHLDIRLGLWRVLYCRCLGACVVRVPLSPTWCATVAIGGGVRVGLWHAEGKKQKVKGDDNAIP